MNAKKHTPLSLHGLRLLFPPLATLGILFLTEWIARGSLTGETFTQYIFPHAEAYLLAWAMLFLSWLAVDWLTRFAPLATLLAAVLGWDEQGDPLVLAAHEKADGPHGILAGMTGSGKSELLLSYILSLSCSCSPETVSLETCSVLPNTRTKSATV